MVLSYSCFVCCSYGSCLVSISCHGLGYGSSGEKGEILGKYFIAFGISMFSGPFLCSILTMFLSYRGVLLVTLFFPAISIILFLLED